MKGLYRLGVAYTRIGELAKARDSLNKVLTTLAANDSKSNEDDSESQKMKKTAEMALKDVDAVELRNKKKEKQML